jgi:hypothetical protein
MNNTDDGGRTSLTDNAALPRRRLGCATQWVTELGLGSWS